MSEMQREFEVERSQPERVSLYPAFHYDRPGAGIASWLMQFQTS